MQTDLSETGDNLQRFKELLLQKERINARRRAFNASRNSSPINVESKRSNSVVTLARETIVENRRASNPEDLSKVMHNLNI